MNERKNIPLYVDDVVALNDTEQAGYFEHSITLPAGIYTYECHMNLIEAAPDLDPYDLGSVPASELAGKVGPMASAYYYFDVKVE